MKASKQTASFVAACLMIFAGFPMSFAGGPLNLNPEDPDNFERWAGGGAGISFNPDRGGLGPQSSAQAIANTEAAFMVWQDVATSTATYTNEGRMPFDVNENNFAPFAENLFFGTNVSDGLSPIVYDQNGAIFAALFGPDSGVLGFASPDTFDANGVPIEGVSFLNGGAMLDGFPAADFFGVQVHEFGHYSGMAHTVVNGQSVLFGDASGPSPFNTYGDSPLNQVETMYPFIFEDGGQGTLHQDEIAFISVLYPAARYFADSGSFSGTILALNGSTPLTGVNVIARNVAGPFEDAVSAISGDRGETGDYTLNGLTQGESYTVHIDGILAGGFSTPPILLPGPEEFFNGASESDNIGRADDPGDSVALVAHAGTPTTGIDVILNGFRPGGALPVGDDGFVELSLPFSFRMCGQRFDSVFVNANGNLTFGAPGSGLSESDQAFLGGPPRIAGLWDDLNPAAGGTVTFGQNPKAFTARYIGVPEFPGTGANSFEITLREGSSRINVRYGALSAGDGLAGASCGGAVTSGFEPAIDLSDFSARRVELSRQPAAYEIFDEDNPPDLANLLLRYSGVTNYQDRLEPNNGIGAARPIALPFDTIPVHKFTEIDPAGRDVDYFRFHAQAGTTLIAQILSGGIDSVLGLYQMSAPGSGTLIAVDDDSGGGLLSRLIVPIPATGAFALAVSTFPDVDFTGDGFPPGGRYVLDVFTVEGTVLSLGDDDTINRPIGFTFPYQGRNWSDVWVNSNGNLTFGTGDTTFLASVDDLLDGPPRIAPLWDDLSPDQGGMVMAAGDASALTVTFMNVPQFAAGDSNNFSVTLNADGSVLIHYGEVDAIDGLSGVTEGRRAADPGESDLSAGGPFPVSGTTYQHFDEGDGFDLENSVLVFE
ncbi:MAG: hypothetical protein H0W33_12950 [Gammaproteobacteria bacterium]|nr:hypothetical protein [Gammaproteobacteria bacterium]